MNKRKSKKVILFSLLLAPVLVISLGLASAPKLATAQFAVPLPTFVGGEEANPGKYIQALYKYGIMLAALLAMAQIVVGAIQYTAAAGSPSGKETAKSRIFGALFGLVMLISAVLVLNTINPELTDLTPPAEVGERAKDALKNAGGFSYGEGSGFESLMNANKLASDGAAQTTLDNILNSTSTTDEQKVGLLEDKIADEDAYQYQIRTEYDAWQAQLADEWQVDDELDYITAGKDITTLINQGIAAWKTANPGKEPGPDDKIDLTTRFVNDEEMPYGVAARILAENRARLAEDTNSTDREFKYTSARAALKAK